MICAGRATLLVLAVTPAITCTADTAEPTGAVDQAVINPPLPTNLSLVANARNTLTIGPFTEVFGDVASSGPNGSVVFDVSSSQSPDNVLANTVKVRIGAFVGIVFGNDITVEGSARQKLLGLDVTALPQVPNLAAGTPGTTNVSVASNQAKQLCPGQYGTISLARNARLNLNGGVYQVNRLTLAEGARLEPSEPVVIKVAGNMVTNIGAFVGPSEQAIITVFTSDIRIEVAGAITLGASSEIHAHLFAPNGKITTADNVTLDGAAWAKNIVIGSHNRLFAADVVSPETPTVPPPCNDLSACTTDQCVTSGTVAFCRNTPLPAGTSCDDGNLCNGAELCDDAGACESGAPPSTGTSCSDGDACNGDETCDGFLFCLSGTPPVVNDENSCTTDVCDPATGVSHDPLPDGTTCSGAGVCDGGTCSIEAATFSRVFLAGQPSFSQCESFNLFASQLTASSYHSVTLSGTFDPAGITCNDPLSATQICQALHNASPASVFCNGHSWNVGSCGPSVDLALDSSLCVCSFEPSYALVPCIANENWGGVNTATCGAPTQSITIACQ